MRTQTGMASVDIEPYEGLIFTTARKFAGMAGMEEEDMRQELRLKTAQALVAYQSSRSKLAVKNFVFGCLTNRVTDLRKSHCRKLNYGISMRYIEDFKDDHGAAFASGGAVQGRDGSDRFEFRYFHVEQEQVYGKIDEGTFVLPSTVTEQERSVLLLLTLEMSHSEIAIRLGTKRAEVLKCVERLREKFADWNPVCQAAQQTADPAVPIAA